MTSGPARPVDERGYSSGVQQPWCIRVDAGGRIGTSDLLKRLVRLRLPLATDLKVGVRVPPSAPHPV